MSVSTVVSQLLTLESGLSVSAAILAEAAAHLRAVIGADYDEVYQRTLTVDMVLDSSGYAKFQCTEEHQRVTGDPIRGFVTGSSFTVPAYNGTFGVEVVYLDTFYILNRFSGKRIVYAGDDDGVVKHWRFADYELAEARFACMIAAMALKKHHKDEVFFSDRGSGEQFGKGTRQPAQLDEFRKNEAYHRQHAHNILYSLGYSIGAH